MGTLAGREVAAYAVSRAAGWDVVPPTVMRDGPFGPGMCQLWIDHDTDVDLIALSRRTDHAGLRDMAGFGPGGNSAHGKNGHLLPEADRPPTRSPRTGPRPAHAHTRPTYRHGG